jgi:hypothetical protein
MLDSGNKIVNQLVNKMIKSKKDSDALVKL